jgi:hypothetical protein
MHWLTDLMRRTEGGIRIDAPEGEVWLSPTPTGIKADYRRGNLVNGSATAYAESVKQAALDYACELELPWSSHPDGTIRVEDSQLYYKQTFRPDILASETLLRWKSKSCA